jgi:hypothetical protein
MILRRRFTVKVVEGVLSLGISSTMRARNIV